MTKRSEPETIFAPLRSVQLPDAVKAHMRAELSAYADLHAVSPRVALQRSPFSYWAPLSRVFTVLLLMVGVVGGSAYASSDALPGDPLYAVKLRIAEPVQTALIPTKEGKASWHAVLAERRLEEATKLAVAGKLDASIEGTITENFALQVERSLAVSDEIREGGNAEVALMVRSDLEARITAHEEIVERVASHIAQKGDETSGVARLLASVGERREAIASARVGDEVVLARADTKGSARIPEVAEVSSRAAVMMMASDNVPTEAISNARESREQEVSAILMKHASFLSELSTIPASTTASTTATSTATTTIESEIPTEE